MKVLSIVGNRPQFVKSAPLSLALREAGIAETVLHTGQHYDRQLSQVFFEELGLAEPDYRLDLHSSDPRAMRPGIASALELERPDWALVFGDTNSTLAGAQAALEKAVPVAHVEAGLRSGDLSMPEERNRIEVDTLADLLLCPDEGSRATLEAEAVAGRVEVVGDVMADALRLFAPIALERSMAIDRLGVMPGGFVAVTIHREANVEPARLRALIAAIGELGEPIVFPAHPRTRAAIESSGISIAPSVQLVEPLGYLDMLALVSTARVLVTDSGGLQKEAYWLGTPCVTVRATTEWVDTVRVGANALVDPSDLAALGAAVRSASMPAERPELYGDGHASERVAEALQRAATVG